MTALNSFANDVNASFFVAVLPNLIKAQPMATHDNPMACMYGSALRSKTKPPDVTESAPLGDLGNDSSILRCDLVNATYDLMFNTTNGNQSIRIATEVVEPQEPIKVVAGMLGPKQPWNSMACSSEPRLIAGSNAAVEELGCVVDDLVVERLAYQSIMLGFK